MKILGFNSLKHINLFMRETIRLIYPYLLHMNLFMGYSSLIPHPGVTPRNAHHPSSLIPHPSK